MGASMGKFIFMDVGALITAYIYLQMDYTNRSYIYLGLSAACLFFGLIGLFTLRCNANARSVRPFYFWVAVLRFAGQALANVCMIGFWH